MYLTIKQSGNEVKLKVLDGSILSLLIMKNPDTVFIAQDKIDESPGPVDPDVLVMNSVIDDSFKPMKALMTLVEYGKWPWNDAIRLVSRFEAMEANVTFEVDARYSASVVHLLNEAGFETAYIY